MKRDEEWENAFGVLVAVGCFCFCGALWDPGRRTWKAQRTAREAKQRQRAGGLRRGVWVRPKVDVDDGDVGWCAFFFSW